MGRYVFRLPDVGEGTAEAELVVWHVAPGDTIEEDQPIVDVMTDKATVEIPAPASGKVLSITGVPGDKLAVGSDILVLEVEGAGNASADAVAGPPPVSLRSPHGDPAPTCPIATAPAQCAAVEQQSIKPDQSKTTGQRRSAACETSA